MKNTIKMSVIIILTFSLLLLSLYYMGFYIEGYKPMIDHLKEGKSYSIQTLSVGCFHSSHEKMIIKREKGKYYIRVKNKEKILSEDEINLIRHFEIELQEIAQDKSFCVTLDKYILKYKGMVIDVIDGTCYWHGSKNLKNKLGFTI